MTGGEREHRPVTFDDPRVYLAGERTLLAWIRTGVAMMGLGFVVARFGLFLHEIAPPGSRLPARHAGLSFWFGTALIAIGVAVNLLAAAQHSGFVRRLKRGEAYVPPRVSPGIVIAVILSVLGLAMAVYLAAIAR